MNRFSRLVLLLLVGAVLLSSCAQGDGRSDTGSADGTNSGKPDETAPAEPEETTIPDKQFNGSTVTVLCRSEKGYEFSVEAETGDIVEDAVFARNRSVEEKHDVVLEIIQTEGDWSHKDSFMGTVRNSILAGDGDYDLVAGYNAYIAQMTLEKCFLNILELPDLDFSNPWWCAGFNENMTINGRLYMCLGDASLTMWENLQAVFFNKALAENYKLPSPYEMIAGDAWTYDKLSEYCAAFSGDLDNNGVMNEKDNWGMVFYNVRDYPVYFESPYCQTGEDGFPYISLWNDRFAAVYDRIYRFMCTEKLGRQFAPAEDQAIFSQDRAMFYQAPLRYAGIFRDMESDFGIIPFPKFDENQERYYTPVIDDQSVFCVPMTVSDPELCGSILEALCRESYEYVIPEYYEMALMRKYARDEESEAMLDLIRESIWFDIGFVYSQALGSLGTVMDIIKNDDPDIASHYESMLPKYEAALETFRAVFED